MATSSIRTISTTKSAKRTHSFRFVDEELHRKLIALLKSRARGKYEIDADGFVHYSHDDEDLIGNDLISTVRANVFPSWQVLAFPQHWTSSYRRYMHEHEVPYREEIRDGELRFLVERGRRPHLWALKQPPLNGR